MCVTSVFVLLFLCVFTERTHKVPASKIDFFAFSFVFYFSEQNFVCYFSIYKFFFSFFHLSLSVITVIIQPHQKKFFFCRLPFFASFNLRFSKRKCRLFVLFRFNLSRLNFSQLLFLSLVSLNMFE